MTAKFTPGPWEFSERIHALAGKDGRLVRFYGDGIVIAMSSPSDEEKANWTLAKSAPEMYEALKNVLAVVESLDVYQRYTPVNNQIREALAKAEGGKS